MSKSPDQKRFPVRRTLVAAGAVLSAAALGACSADNPQPVKTSSIAPSPSASPKTNEARPNNANLDTAKAAFNKQALETAKALVTDVANPNTEQTRVDGILGFANKLSPDPSVGAFMNVRNINGKNIFYVQTLAARGKKAYDVLGVSLTLKSDPADSPLFNKAPDAAVSVEDFIDSINSDTFEVNYIEASDYKQPDTLGRYSGYTSKGDLVINGSILLTDASNQHYETPVNNTDAVSDTNAYLANLQQVQARLHEDVVNG